MREIGMSVNLNFLPLKDLGINGINTQSNPSSLDSTWLTRASNIVIKESGKIGFRKGIKQQTLHHSSNKPIGAIIEHTYTDTADTVQDVILCAVDGKMYEVDIQTPGNAFTSEFNPTSSTDDWQLIEFNDEVYCLQAGAVPIEFEKGTWTEFATGTHDVPAALTTFDPSCGMGHYGRLWVGGVTENKDVLYYSDTLNAHEWITGNSGFIDLKTVWGTDEIVAVQPFYGKIAIFGRHNIVIYSNPWAASGSNYSSVSADSMQLDEIIRGTGCVSRDSVQAVGDDLFFLTDTGLRSLVRTTEKENLPLQDLSMNIKDTLIRIIQRSNKAKGIYVENEGVYILNFVSINETYVFDVKHLLRTGTPRVTTWVFDKVNKRQPSCFSYSSSQGLLIGQESGSVATYEGYFDDDIDNVLASGTPVRSLHPYTTTLSTVWVPLGQSVFTSILKKLKLTFEGGKGTVISVKWFKDFNERVSKSHVFELYSEGNTTPSLYGSALWSCNTDYDYDPTDTETPPDQPANCTSNESKYITALGTKEYNIPLSGSSRHFKLEISAATNGFEAALQEMIILTKQGKIT